MAHGVPTAMIDEPERVMPKDLLTKLGDASDAAWQLSRNASNANDREISDFYANVAKSIDRSVAALDRFLYGE
jgi:hypothetical protein